MPNAMLNHRQTPPAPAPPEGGPHAAIVCSDVWKVFGEAAGRAVGNGADKATALAAAGLIVAVRGVSFSVGHGELFVIMGLSGSGKSTLVRCLSRLIEPTAGHVLIDGEDILTATTQRLIDLRRRKMGMVFQHFGLFPHMTVAQNVAFPLKMQGVAADRRRARAREVIDLVGLTGREANYPRDLSGGQRQRVGIARSLAVNPEIWFLDEPFSALDPLIRRQLQDEFLRLQATLHKSIVFITHDFGEALRIADRIAILRDGAVVQIGTPSDIVLTPADDYVAQFSRDIPRGRLMRVEALMRPLDGRVPPVTGGRVLQAAMPVEEALMHCVAGQGAITVVNGDGKPVGRVDTDALARAIGPAVPPGAASGDTS